jgi:hypothetical protein
MAVSASLALCTLPVAAQRISDHVHIAVSRAAPSRSFSAPAHGIQRFGSVRTNSFGRTPALPTWERPNYSIPHWETSKNPIRPWELGPSNRIHNPDRHDWGHHRRGWYGVGYAALPYYGFPYGISYIDPLAMAESDMMDEDAAQQAQPAPARQEYTPQPPHADSAYDDGYPPPRAPYNPEAYSAPAAQNNASAENAAPATDGLDHPAVTLVFKDGRPPQKVRSYALTGSSIFVAEPGHQRTIPIADLDLPATIAQNREAGVDFQLPGASK